MSECSVSDEQKEKLNPDKARMSEKDKNSGGGIDSKKLVCFCLAGKQFIASEGDSLVVPKSYLSDCDNLGDNSFKTRKVLAVLENNQLKVGRPYLERELVFKLQEEFKGKKIIVFKKKKRKGYQKKIGYRPLYQKIQVVSF